MVKIFRVVANGVTVGVSCVEGVVCNDAVRIARMNPGSQVVVESVDIPDSMFSLHFDYTSQEVQHG